VKAALQEMPARPASTRRHATNVKYALSILRQCVLDVGNALKGGDMPHRHALMVSWRGMDDAPYEVERLSLHPVPCLPARVPMSSTHSRPFCRIGAPTVEISARLLWFKASM